MVLTKRSAASGYENGKFTCHVMNRARALSTKMNNDKDGEMRDKNPQLVAQHCFVASFCRCFPFFTLHDQPDPQQKICCRLKKVVAKSRARVYFEQPVLALLLIFHRTYNLSRNKIARVLLNQPISAPHLFNPQQMFLLRVNLIVPGEKRETSTKTCNETMLRDKSRVFVYRIRRLKADTIKYRWPLLLL